MFHNLVAAEAPVEGTYDLVTAFECIHDMGYPVILLEAMKGLVSNDGTVRVKLGAIGTCRAASSALAESGGSFRAGSWSACVVT